MKDRTSWWVTKKIIFQHMSMMSNAPCEAPLCLPLLAHPWAAPAYGFRCVFICVWERERESALLACFIWLFFSSGRLTLHTLHSIVKDRSIRLQHMICITSWLLREEFQHQPTSSLVLQLCVYFSFVFGHFVSLDRPGSAKGFEAHEAWPKLTQQRKSGGNVPFTGT